MPSVSCSEPLKSGIAGKGKLGALDVSQDGESSFVICISRFSIVLSSTIGYVMIWMISSLLISCMCKLFFACKIIYNFSSSKT